MTIVLAIYLLSVVVVYGVSARELIVKKQKSDIQTWGDIISIFLLGVTPILNSIFAGIIISTILEPFFKTNLWSKKLLPCKHEGNFRELMSCQAVCCDCNQEIGFIGTVREQARGTNRKEVGQQSWS